MTKQTLSPLLAIITLAVLASPVAAHGDETHFLPLFSGKTVIAISMSLALIAVFATWRKMRSHLQTSLYGIIGLTLITTFVHILVGFNEIILTLNGVGYLVLLGALFLPNRRLADFRQHIRWGLLGYTILTISMYFVIHPWGMSDGVVDRLGLVTKAIELILVALLFIEIINNKKVLVATTSPQA